VLLLALDEHSMKVSTPASRSGSNLTTHRPSTNEDVNIDFEDQLQDYAYLSSAYISRTKRESFPESPDSSSLKRNKEDQTVSIFNSDGEYEYVYEVINDTAKTSFNFTKLRPYSTYQISIKACREMVNASMNLWEKDEHCGPETQINSHTLKVEANDLIETFEVMNYPTNDSLSSIKVSWNAPKKPNGQLLAYTIRHMKTDDETSRWEYVCKTHRDYINKSFLILDSLTNGNYSIEIAATTLAGMGNFSAPKYIVINLATSHSLMFYLSLILLVLVLLSIAGFTFIYVYRKKSSLRSEIQYQEHTVRIDGSDERLVL